MHDYQQHPPVECRLSGEEQERRRESVARDLFSAAQESRELDDGYELLFPGGEELVERLTSFVVSERKCCPFLTFEMLFEPEGGPVSLRVWGPEGTKSFISDELERSGAR